MTTLPQDAYVVGLLTLPQLWPSRMAALLGMRRETRRGLSLFGADEPVIRRTPAEVWKLVCSGSVGTDPCLRRALGARSDPDVLGPAWAQAAAGIDIEDLWARHRSAAVLVDLLGTPGYPQTLSADAGAPYAVFRSGSHPDLSGPCVAVVGTRRCTQLGREIAAEYGEALSRAGARVVSGLALGIDAGAHEGALRARAAPPVGVVAGGFDRPYPARHRALWRDVQRAGVLVSEWPLGARSEGWRFPARNRIIAAIADAVVVVESRLSGGSVITAEQALMRNKPVFAVPGSVRSPASEGTNRLLSDGAIPACAVDDVVASLDLVRLASPSRTRPAPQGQAGEVLAAVGWEPTPMDVILRRSPHGRAVVALELAHLELDGWVRNGTGGWQRIDRS